MLDDFMQESWLFGDVAPPEAHRQYQTSSWHSWPLWTHCSTVLVASLDAKCESRGGEFGT